MILNFGAISNRTLLKPNATFSAVFNHCVSKQIEEYNSTQGRQEKCTAWQEMKLLTTLTMLENRSKMSHLNFGY